MAAKDGNNRAYQPPRLYDIGDAEERAQGASGCVGGGGDRVGSCTGGGGNQGSSCNGGGGNTTGHCVGGGGSKTPLRRRR